MTRGASAAVTSEVLSAADGLEESTEGSYVAGRHRGEGTTLSAGFVTWAPDQAADIYDMAPVAIPGHPLTARAGLVWNGDLSRPLQQVLVDTAMENIF